MARVLQHRPATQFFELQTSRSTDHTTTIKKTCHAYCHDDTMTSDSLNSGGIALGGRSDQVALAEELSRECTSEKIWR